MPSPTLIVMAAGIGSRYGGLKQMDPFGPSGEIILDYSIYDALQSGFEHVVFIESLYVIENFLRTDSPLFPDANALKFPVEDEDIATIEERHVVLDADPLIPECAARMCQQ